MKILVVVDCQNDFITGSLGSPAAVAIIPKVIEKIKSLEEGDCIILTQDEHYTDYLDTQEGKNLPVKHCIKDTEGSDINSSIMDAIDKNRKIDGCLIYRKNTFGSLRMGYDFYKHEQVEDTKGIDIIEFVGLCTDICVISNALITKAYLPEVEIVVDASCCAGVTPESHKAALTVMKSCQIKVINEH